MAFPIIGNLAPKFSLTNHEDKTVSLSDFKGEQERLSGARAFRFLARFFPAGKQQQDKQSRQMGIENPRRLMHIIPS